MELHRLHGQFAMPHAHNDAVSVRRNLERRGQQLANAVQRMVRPTFSGEGNPANTPLPSCVTIDGFAVHRIRQHAQFAAKAFHHALQSEAHAERWQRSRRRVAHQVGTPNPRASGPGDTSRMSGFNSSIKESGKPER